jgi:predicted RNA-binding Zn ribbon-like protein
MAQVAAKHTLRTLPPIGDQLWDYIQAEADITHSLKKASSRNNTKKSMEPIASLRQRKLLHLTHSKQCNPE